MAAQGATVSTAEDPRLVAAVDLIGRTGAKEAQVRWSDDEEPTVWFVVAKYADGTAEAAAGMNPLVAAIRLVEQLVDGGACAHCGRPSAVSTDWQHEQPLDDVFCWYVYDPETEKFRRSCEGETTGKVFGRDPRTGRIVGRNDPCPCGSGEKWKRCHGA